MNSVILPDRLLGVHKWQGLVFIFYFGESSYFLLGLWLYHSSFLACEVSSKKPVVNLMEILL